MKKIVLAITTLLILSSTNALTLDEYGISLTSDGLVDHQTGLRWLDSTYTIGDTATLLPLLDAGWRIATETEFYYLMSRQTGTFGADISSALNYSAFVTVLERLYINDYAEFIGVGTIHDFPNPWLCNTDQSTGGNCGDLTAMGGQFAFTAMENLADGTTLFSTFTATVPQALYMQVTECLPAECQRALLVRNVPIPGAIVLLLSAMIGSALTMKKRERLTIYN